MTSDVEERRADFQRAIKRDRRIAGGVLGLILVIAFCVGGLGLYMAF